MKPRETALVKEAMQSMYKHIKPVPGESEAKRNERFFKAGTIYGMARQMDEDNAVRTLVGDRK